MSSRFRSLLLITSTLALLSGCATVADTPDPDSYQLPAAGTPVAYLTGSKITEGGLFGTDHLGFVTMIDLKTVNHAPDKWNEAIPLTPGKHVIVGEDHYSNFVGRTYLTFEAMAGGRYQLMIKVIPEPAADGRLYSDFWIVDQATGKSVTKVYHQQLTGGKKGTIFNIPS